MIMPSLPARKLRAVGAVAGLALIAGGNLPGSPINDTAAVGAVRVGTNSSNKKTRNTLARERRGLDPNNMLAAGIKTRSQAGASGCRDEAVCDRKQEEKKQGSAPVSQPSSKHDLLQQHVAHFEAARAGTRVTPAKSPNSSRTRRISAFRKKLFDLVSARRPWANTKNIPDYPVPGKVWEYSADKDIRQLYQERCYVGLEEIPSNDNVSSEVVNKQKDIAARLAWTEEILNDPAMRLDKQGKLPKINMYVTGGSTATDLYRTGQHKATVAIAETLGMDLIPNQNPESDAHIKSWKTDGVVYANPCENATFEERTETFNKLCEKWEQTHRDASGHKKREHKKNANEDFHVLDPYIYKEMWTKSALAAAPWAGENVPITYFTQDVGEARKYATGGSDGKVRSLPEEETVTVDVDGKGTTKKFQKFKNNVKVVVKPGQDSWGSEGVAFCDSKACVDKHCELILTGNGESVERPGEVWGVKRPVIVQEFLADLDGKYYSSSILAVGGEVIDEKVREYKFKKSDDFEPGWNPDIYETGQEAMLRYTTTVRRHTPEELAVVRRFVKNAEFTNWMSAYNPAQPRFNEKNGKGITGIFSFEFRYGSSHDGKHVMKIFDVQGPRLDGFMYLECPITMLYWMRKLAHAQGYLESHSSSSSSLD